MAKEHVGMGGVADEHIDRPQMKQKNRCIKKMLSLRAAAEAALNTTQVASTMPRKQLLKKVAEVVNT